MNGHLQFDQRSGNRMHPTNLASINAINFLQFNDNSLENFVRPPEIRLIQTAIYRRWSFHLNGLT